MRQQEVYLHRLSANLHQHYKAQKQKFHKRRKDHLANSNLYSNFYKSAPTWVEVNYLTLSFFVLWAPLGLAFDCVGYNPYLSRLLSF